MADGNVPSSVSLDSFIPPSSKGSASPSSNPGDDQKKAQKRAESIATDAQQFQLFEAAIAGIEADARQKGGLTKFDVAIIRGLQRDMLAIGQRFVQRGTESVKTSAPLGGNKTKETNVNNWQRVTKGLESMLALKPGFDEDGPDYQRAAKGYKKSLLLSTRKDLAKGTERYKRQMESSGAAAFEAKLEQTLLKRGQSYVNRPAYTDRLSETEAESLPPEPPAPSSFAAKLSEVVSDVEKNASAEPVATPEYSAQESPSEAAPPTPEDTKPTTPEESPAADSDEPPPQVVEEPTSATEEVTPSPRLEQPLPDAESPTAAQTAPSLGTPLASSVLGAVAAKRNEAPAEETSAPDEVAPLDAASHKIENALKELDQQEDALIQRSDKAQERKKGEKLSVDTFEELRTIAREQQAIHQKRLNLYLENGKAFPGQYNSLFDQKDLESAVRHGEGAIEERELATLRRRYEDVLSAAELKTLDGIIIGLNKARYESRDEKKLHDAAQVGAQKLVQRALEKLTSFQQTHSLPSALGTQASIASVRQELRQEFAVKQEQSLVLVAYEERMREYAWESLKATDQVQYARLQSLQASNPSVLVDVTLFLHPDEQEAVQLHALADVRKQFPDTSDELISHLLLEKAVAAQKALERVGAQSALSALGAAALGSTVAKAAAISMIAPMVGGLLRDANRRADALRGEEERIAVRAGKIKQLLNTAPQPGQEAAHQQELNTLRQEQQQALGSRRKLQASLHSQTAALENLQDFSGIKTNGNQVSAPQPQQLENAGMLAGLLADRGIQPAASEASSDVGLSGSSAPVRSGPGSSARPSALSAKDEAEATANAAEHSAQIASRLASNQLRDRRLAEMNQSSSKDSSGSSSGGNDAAPLLSLPVAAKTAAAKFAQEQQAMNRRRDDFSGTGQKPSGYEAMLSEGASDETEDDDSPELTYSNVEMDTDETAEAEEEAAANEDAEMEQQELMRRSQFLELQQESANEQAAAQQQSSGNASRIKQLADSPAGKKLAESAGKLLANPATVLILLVVLFVWLNLRLMLPKEGSILRKPLTPLEKVGTVAFNIFFVFFLLISLIMTVVMVIVPFLPFLLPIGAGLGILQAALHLFG